MDAEQIRIPYRFPPLQLQQRSGISTKATLQYCRVEFSIDMNHQAVHNIMKNETAVQEQTRITLNRVYMVVMEDETTQTKAMGWIILSPTKRAVRHQVQRGELSFRSSFSITNLTETTLSRLTEKSGADHKREEFTLPVIQYNRTRFYFILFLIKEDKAPSTISHP